MNSEFHRSFWAKCSQCGHWAWDIYMAYATLKPQAYVCLFCAGASKKGTKDVKVEQAKRPSGLVGGTPCAPEDFLCNCD